MRTRKVYSEEFKRKAVRMAGESGNRARTARDLGISEDTLRRWEERYSVTDAPIVIPLSPAVPELDHSISIELLEKARAQRLAVSETALAEVRNIDSTLHYLKRQASQQT